LAKETGESLWEVKLLSAALADLRNLPAKLRALAWEIVTDLAFDPYPRNAEQLRNFEDYWRIRVDGYRIVYRVSEQRKRVVVERVASRGVVYSGLER
jgi:mRNA-degrading endonuclease RelE of RelBE toxin-antitoxin system